MPTRDVSSVSLLVLLKLLFAPVQSSGSPSICNRNEAADCPSQVENATCNSVYHHGCSTLFPLVETLYLLLEGTRLQLLVPSFDFFPFGFVIMPRFVNRKLFLKANTIAR
jgi:hypothetical protein